MELKDRTILLGVTGGIAIHKSLDYASQLVKWGASVHVIMTKNATRLINPLQFQVLSRNSVLLDLFETGEDWKPPHIDLADRADLLVIVPATANILGKMANGIADDALSTVAVSVHCPILVAPAMNGHMYQNPFVQRNIDTLSKHGVQFVEPASGDLACGYEGIGRLNEVDVILERTKAILNLQQDLHGKRILVTAGATREYIDPVRFITNRSSGKMGYALAEAASRRGATVQLISGHATVSPPPGIEICNVETTQEMHEAVLQRFKETDIAIMAAAPADYRPAEFSPNKIKKQTDTLNIALQKNPDTAQTIGGNKKYQVTVCFAAETNDVLENAKEKLIRKNCDLIVANDILAEGAGFAGDTNIVTLLDKAGNCEQLPLLSKQEVANVILDRIVKLMGK
ncbi:MAG: bifunctional phosphopantothenoylcysteine decarboxylase/phosphopantothenate--cysteine ligase CoaBC [Candidatus Poribacteria bacterium]|nr:bifunctional phosphopantothenoylcysteine decarboxylase/phosphopantothenate--cysteine ligase CoaBC [Candidatus Poribacteria bacterium]